MSLLILKKQLPLHKSIIKAITNSINSLIDSVSNEVSLELIVPTNIVYRTQLICDYISKETGRAFDIYDLIMLTYMDFIESSIKKYQPNKVIKELRKTYEYDDVIKISYGDNVYEYERTECNKKIVDIKMSKSDAAKGQLLLDELKDLYGDDIKLDKFIYKIWINFIEDYKRGENNNILKTIVKMLKNISA